MLGADWLTYFVVGMVVCLLLSATVILLTKEGKKRLGPTAKWAVLLIILLLCLVGVKWGIDQFKQSSEDAEKQAALGNPYRKALAMLNEPYPSYTSVNNLFLADRTTLVERFSKMEKLPLVELKPMVSALRVMIEKAPGSGQPGLYNMQLTDEIKSQWDRLRRDLEKKSAEASK